MVGTSQWRREFIRRCFASTFVLLWPLASNGQVSAGRPAGINVPAGSRFDKSSNLPERQPAAVVAQEPGVTTVSPLIVRPELNVLGTIPELSPQMLTEAADSAHETAAAD